MKDYNKILIFVFLTVLFFIYTFSLYGMNLDFSSFGGNSADRGKRIWQEKNCTGCHQIYGLGGYLGPDLTNTYSERGTAYIKAFLKSGTQTMPDFKLTDQEVENLTEYLKSIDKSGIGRPSQLKINYDGTIAQPEK